MTLTAAFDELIATNELREWCDAYITYQEMEDLATLLSGNFPFPA